MAAAASLVLVWLEKEALCKCCLNAASCEAQPHSKGASLESVQDCNRLSLLSYKNVVFLHLNLPRYFQDRSWAEYQVAKWK